MRLIDADALKAVEFHPLPYTHIVPTDADAESYKWGWNDAIDAIIESEPTIDAVPVVRCKDCVHQTKFWHNDGRMKNRGYYICGCDLVDGYSHVCLDDDFCSRGERMDGEQDYEITE